MPQLIAMVVVVVAAMIYMFQTFGGTGDKIEGVAQKTSIITEINNLKSGLKIAAKAGHIEQTGGTNTERAQSLEGLAELAYFPEQVNDQVDVSTTTDSGNVYKAISFGATDDLILSLVNTVTGATPGIFVDLTQGKLKANAAFLEAQIATDLASIATIDRKAKTSVGGATLKTTGTDAEKRTPADSTAGSDSDGMFIIYFGDFGSNEVVVAKAAVVVTP